MNERDSSGGGIGIEEAPGGVLEAFRPATRIWFEGTFEAPTEVQTQGWAAIQRGEHSLLIAPTGSGKTLAAFLWAIDRLARPASSEDPAAESATPGVRALYVSPLKALVYDIERNLRTPRAGIARAAEGAGAPLILPGVDMRTGDTPQSERRRQRVQPEEILVTTPESLFLILTSQARETLRTVEWVIVDEVHALAPTKRGAHLALSLERLAHLTGSDPQRIGLSATARPTSEVARFLGGRRPVTVVDTHRPPHLDLQVVVPVPDMTRPMDGFVRRHPHGEDGDDTDTAPEVDPTEEAANRDFGIWPAVTRQIVDLVRAHRSTLVFVNSRGLCERLAQRINDEAGEELALAHHGSLAHSQRRVIEEALKAGSLPAIVATSSLELGIDMGALDLVVLVESPGSVASGLQRIGRAGHAVGEVSVGRVFPKHRGDLLEATVLARRMREGLIEPQAVPEMPLDVLAQHVVSMTVTDAWKVDDLRELVRGAASYSSLPDTALEGVLDLLSGLYPSHDFADLRPRIRWDRERDVLEARRGARVVVVSNAGTIPDRGLFHVHLGADGPRLGELDEEMVHESQPGQVITLGASTWRILEITRDRVLVEPAPGEPGRLPFWHGEGPGRPLELGRAMGAFIRELSALDEERAQEQLTEEYGLDASAATNLRAYLAEQRAATGTLPTDRSVIVERFRDELGDWRVCILTPFGARVHAPWALAIRRSVSANVGYDVQAVWSDDGIVVTVADGDEPPDIDLLVPDAAELDDRLVQELPRSPVFASHFRENAARALLLPRRRPGARVPLFAQRLRAQKLLGLALEYPSFPMVLETYRTILKDVFDVPALKEVLGEIEEGRIRVEEVETATASPFARGLVFSYVAAYLYEGDSPSAERRAHMLSLDMDLLREILGEGQLRELLDQGEIDEVEARLQGLSEGRRARNSDGVHDLLRRVGDLTTDEIRDRSTEDPEPWLEELAGARLVGRVRVAGRDAWIAIEDAGLYRDALGVDPPAGTPDVFLAEVADPLDTLLVRWSRTHGPFTVDDVAGRWTLVTGQTRARLEALAREGRLRQGRFTPGRDEMEWCDPDVLREIKRRALARLRGEVAPVPRDTLGRFLPEWHGLDAPATGRGALEDAITRLQGMPLSVRDLESVILPSRVPGFHPRLLDELGATGWLVWVGHSPVRSRDGRIRLFRRDQVGTLLEPPEPDEDAFERTPVHESILQRLDKRGASFFFELLEASGLGSTSAEQHLAADALADLVWAGLVTNDTFGALRTLLGRTRASGRRSGRSRTARGRSGRGGMLALGGRWALVRDLVDSSISGTERAHALALQLLERHGLLTRDSMTIEVVPGGFSSIYPVLRTMEEAAKVRRGYFVEGLGGAQFARAGVIDRLRRVREGDEDRVVLLAATDPANPFGWLMPWPAFGQDDARPPQRSVGSRVVLVDGEAVLYLHRGGRRVRVRRSVDFEVLARALEAVRPLASHRRRRQLEVELIDDEPALSSPWRPAFESAGFTASYKALILHEDHARG